MDSFENYRDRFYDFISEGWKNLSNKEHIETAENNFRDARNLCQNFDVTSYEYAESSFGYALAKLESAGTRFIKLPNDSRVILEEIKGLLESARAIYLTQASKLNTNSFKSMTTYVMLADSNLILAFVELKLGLCQNVFPIPHSPPGFEFVSEIGNRHSLRYIESIIHCSFNHIYNQQYEEAADLVTWAKSVIDDMIKNCENQINKCDNITKGSSDTWSNKEALQQKLENLNELKHDNFVICRIQCALRFLEHSRCLMVICCDLEISYWHSHPSKPFTQFVEEKLKYPHSLALSLCQRWIEHKSSSPKAGVIIINEYGHVLTVTEGTDLMGIVKGRIEVEKGESAEMCIAREVREELSLDTTKMELNYVFDSKDITVYVFKSSTTYVEEIITHYQEEIFG